MFSLLFDRRYDKSSGQFTEMTVTSDEIQDAIVTLKQYMGISLSVTNPANFLKDFLRSKTRNKQWPSEISQAGYTARQAYSEGRVFDFVPYEKGQTVPFPDDFELPDDVTIHEIETVSLPSAARALGRGDEAWLIQVCVHQRVLQTHFALFSPIEAIDLFHLQNSLKGTPEIDAVFLLAFKGEDHVPKKALVTLEAKRDEPVLPNQIRSQAAVMAKQTRRRSALADIEFILPVAAATFNRDGKRIVAIFEMEMVSVADGLAAHDSHTAHDLPISIAKVVGYALVPPVVGV
ncbi:MAG: hypothetical protein EOS23_26715 [Mesorhizobium sp.]|nr:MAG: hypothetical protein EOS23_26715 [Mesorhizobium sp.]